MGTQLDLWDIPAKRLPYCGQSATARASDPDTSHEAAAAFSQKRLTAIQLDVLTWFRSVGQGTDEELEAALLGKHPGFSTLRKRRCELVEQRFLKDSGERRMNQNKRNMVVWRVVI